MDQLIENLQAAGVDRERIDRAKKRGIAYQCLRCEERDGTKTINIKCRIEDHILRYHLSQDQQPFFCKLCGFRCMRRDQLITHVTAYGKHVLIAAKARVVDPVPYLVENDKPHVFGAQDYRAHTPEASLLHWLRVSEGDLADSQGAASTTKAGEKKPRPRQTAAPMTSLMNGSSAGQQSPMVPLPPTPTLTQLVPQQNWPFMYGQQPSVAMNTLSGLLSAFVPQRPQLDLSSQVNALIQSLVGGGNATEQPHESATEYEAEDLDAILPQITDSDLQDVELPYAMSEVVQEAQAEAISSEKQEGVESGTVSKEQEEAKKETVNQGQVEERIEIEVGSKQEGVAGGTVNTKGQDTDKEEAEAGPNQTQEDHEAGDRGVEKEADGAQVKMNKVQEVGAVERSDEKLEQVAGDSKRQEKAEAVEASQSQGSEREDTRVIKVKDNEPQRKQSETTDGDEEATETPSYPPYTPTPISKLRERESPAVVQEDILDLTDEDMTLSTPKKRTREEDHYEGHNSKKAREGERPTLPVDIRDLSERTLVNIVDKKQRVAERTIVAAEKIYGALIDATCVLGKLTDAVSRLKNTMVENEKEEERREAKRAEREKRREEEWRKALGRLRDEERRWEERRRELEKKEREEKEEKRKEAETKEKEEKEDRDREERRRRENTGEDRKEDSKRGAEGSDRDDRRKREDRRGDDRDKENQQRPRSVLGRVYTRDNITDGSRRK